MIKIFDILAAIIVLTALAFVKINVAFWVLYAFGCIIYMFIFIKKKLWGAVILNIVATIIAIFNYIG